MKHFARNAGDQGLKNARRAVERLAEDSRVRLVYLFGSTSDGKSEHPRDLDLAMLSDPEISLDERLRIRAELVSAARSNIDLVSLNHASVVLAREVADHGVCLFARTPDDEVEFVTRARNRFWDFSPFLATQWQLTGERIESRRRGPEA